MNKGFEIAHSCVEMIEEASLSEEELNHCFQSLNGYYKSKNEQNQQYREIENKTMIIGLGGAKL